ncbi:ROK family protein [Rubrivivax albus]|uniref:ROK family protein n=1 Tax=Rubrivivax albus TaxID=2499835 RepID=A0A3S3SAR5_9BURK|nr:ROK family protein [Rubrivivax albus]RVT49976.1 ROK family protein [Rubrivivax albus]
MGLALGIDLGGTKTEAALLDADGQAVWRERVPTPAGDYAATLHAVAGLVQRAEAARGPVAHVGVGHPGSLAADGRVKNANSTCLNGQPLQADLERLLARPLRLANDANCLALSEATDGAAAGADVVFAVILGTGVGGGIAVHGRVLAGANGLAGEWGHNPLPWPDDTEIRGAPACYCGHRGCVETWLSGPGIARDHGTPSLAVERIAEAAAAGDAAARATLDRHASRLARALAGVINLLDPDVIVLAGGVSRLPGLTQAVRARWARWIFAAGSSAPPRTRLVTAAHGDASGVRGAAWLWR